MVKQFLVSSLLPFLGVLAPWRLAFPLADAMGWDGLHIAVDVMLVIGQGLLHRKAKQAEKKAERIEQLEKELKNAARDQIHQFLEAEASGLRASIASLTHEIERHAQRLKEGDGEFDALTDRDHQLELKVGQKIEGVKDYVRDAIGRHEEHGNGRFEKLGDAIAQVQKEVAVIADRSGRGSRNAE
jgi:chromosome segregation ATPase